MEKGGGFDGFVVAFVGLDEGAGAGGLAGWQAGGSGAREAGKVLADLCGRMQLRMGRDRAGDCVWWAWDCCCAEGGVSGTTATGAWAFVAWIDRAGEACRGLQGWLDDCGRGSGLRGCWSVPFWQAVLPLLPGPALCSTAPAEGGRCVGPATHGLFILLFKT